MLDPVSINGSVRGGGTFWRGDTRLGYISKRRGQFVVTRTITRASRGSLIARVVPKARKAVRRLEALQLLFDVGSRPCRFLKLN